MSYIDAIDGTLARKLNVSNLLMEKCYHVKINISGYALDIQYALNFFKGFHMLYFFDFNQIVNLIIISMYCSKIYTNKVSPST